MRRFEFVDGKSSKFWEVEASGNDVTVRFGRIGAAGTTQTKTFASAAKATAEADKLIREKTGKGYKEVAASGALAAVAPKPAASKPAAPPPVPASAPETPAVALAAVGAPPVAAPVASGAFRRPPGAFRWTPAWSARAKGYRRDPSLITLDRRSLLATIPLHDGKDIGSSLGAQIGGNLGAMVAQAAGAVSGGAGTFAPGDEVRREVTAERLETWDEGYWRTVFATAAEPRDYGKSRSAWGFQRKLEWAVWTCTVLHGLPRAVQLWLDTAQAQRSMIGHALGHGTDHGLPALHSLIAAADPEAHAAALAIAQRYIGDDDFAILVAYLFPDQPALFDAALAAVKRQSGFDGAPAHVLLDCRVELAQAKALLGVDRVWMYLGVDHMLGPLLDWAQRFGADALPLAVTLLDRQRSADMRKPLVAIVRAFDSEAAFAALVDRVDEKDVRPVVDELGAEYPELLLAIAAERAQATRSKAIEAWLTRLAAAHADLVPAVLPQLGDAAARLLQGLAAKLDVAAEEAEPGDLPELLRMPPWLAKKARDDAPLPALTAIGTTDAMVWPPGLADEWARRYPRDAREHCRWAASRHKVGFEEGILAATGLDDSTKRKALLGGKRWLPSDFAVERWRTNYPFYLAALPPVAMFALWESAPPGDWHDYQQQFDGLVAKHELEFLPGLLRFIGSKPERGLELALPYRAASIAPLAADALRRTKKAKFPAQRWLTAHAELAALALLPLVPRGGTPADDAGVALRWLVANGREAEVRAGVGRYGTDGERVLQHVLEFDALALFPRRMPKLPAFFVPGGFTRPRLANGRALPLDAVQHLGSMLAISTLEARYAGVELVAAACDRASVAEFAWDLFQAWLQSGAPNKESWAFTALGLLGNDESARGLAPLIRQWPGESAHARAVVGLDVLGAIATDVALMHLNGIAQKVKFKGLQEKARERIDAIADARGLTTEELADRLVPDLGLDEHGTLVLDFGPRRFTVGFDEQLRPFVRDADGARLKDLPKPNMADDATLAEDAVARYKALKKDVRTLAAQQLQRFELAMSTRRRWSAEEFRLFLVDHPLQRHLVKRLLWGTYPENGAPTCFRVAEDLTYADAADAQWTLPDDARVGLVHPLELGAGDAAAFGQIFADYEILQPFRQLGREIYVVSDAERAKSGLERFRGKKVATGSVFGLENRGWRRGDPQDGGWIGWFTRPLPGGLEIHLDLDPGTAVGDVGYEPEQKLTTIELRRAGTWDDSGKQPFTALDPILISEVLRDIDLMA